MDSRRAQSGGGGGGGSGGGRPARTPRYDDQAGSFDARTGLPPAAVEAIVDALARLSDLGPDSTILELGAGTGQLGVALAGRAGHYFGVERSGAMLQQFRQRPLPVGGRLTLLQADANERWPLEDGTATLVFGSRSLHLLDSDHLVAESLRVAAPGGAMVCAGALVRDPDGIRRQMRGAMRRILEERHQVVGRKSGDDDRGWIDALARRGGLPVERLVVASWSVQVRPADSLRSWRGKQGLAGHDVSEAIKSDVLDRLEAWALERYGSLEAAVPAEERYALWAVRLIPH
ncbi:MAG TPA: class I SAM-dependent methyltransferase [Anaeromyxobacteraceae bacterium]